MAFEQFPLAEVGEHPKDPLSRSTWPATLPPVAQLLDHGLPLGEATILVGENGSGKSTIVEGIAVAFGLSAEGGSQNALHSTRPTESVLSDHLQLHRHGGASRNGYFLRAETMHGFFTYLEQNPRTSGPPEPRFHEMSHGESFLALVGDRFRSPGLYVLDEPESALSLAGCVALVRTLGQLLERGDSQVLMATHSPVLAALPGADVYEVGPWGLRPRYWDELALVRNWKSFLAEPEDFLRDQ
ncbi:MAG TPA: AAA family ATPase [Galbitalea sp.]|jgi:predicted ATPase|nr:AAA family ATPase [Galbitalea sp.]